MIYLTLISLFLIAAYTAAWAMKTLWKGNVISAFILTKPMFYVELIAFFSTYITLLI